MKVYFSAAMTRYRKLLPLYACISDIIKDLGHEVVSQHVIDPQTTAGDWIPHYEPHQLWEREVGRLQDSNVLVSEVTTPSFGVAFIMDEAIKLHKPQLSLYYALPFQESEIPLMLRGKPDIQFQIYTVKTVRAVLTTFLAQQK